MVVLVECHEVKEGVVKPENDLVGLPENIIGRGLVVEDEVLASIFGEEDWTVGVGLEDSFGFSCEAVVKEGGRNLTIWVGTGNFAVQEKFAMGADVIALFAGFCEELFVVAESAGRIHDDRWSFPVSGTGRFLGGEDGQDGCAVIKGMHEKKSSVLC